MLTHLDRLHTAGNNSLLQLLKVSEREKHAAPASLMSGIELRCSPRHDAMGVVAFCAGRSNNGGM